MTPLIHLCGGETGVDIIRAECSNPLHDYPLPDGYVDAAEEAARRLGHRWRNTRCPDCHTYGWHPGTSRYQLTPTEKENNQ
ncbi:hypothetical protein [uncultured Corynebacterium sp.]|uniref:hypothetical protein n=1 Tax=uncultured Corynebacterium sp. TaxID=159447 RepID=UPI0025980E96|nr:hypothetical protein [uncultured Corynebacterium sp.]